MKGQIAKELRALGELLRRWGYVKNTSNLAHLDVKQLQDGLISYEFNDSTAIIFNGVDMYNHCLPRGIEKIPKDEIDLFVKLMTIVTQSPFDDDGDPIRHLGVNIVVEAQYYLTGHDDLIAVNCAWHLDKGAPQGAEFSHPLYHLNFGGSNMTKQGDVFGKLLLLAAPRIIHPPMDIILSCDFIIRNFYGKAKHEKITKKPEYIRLIERAHRRYWKPYYNAMLSHWLESDKGKIENPSFKDLAGHQ